MFVHPSNSGSQHLHLKFYRLRAKKAKIKGKENEKLF